MSKMGRVYQELTELGYQNVLTIENAIYEIIDLPIGLEDIARRVAEEYNITKNTALFIASANTHYCSNLVRLEEQRDLGLM
jgi:hypothetical protein